MSVIQEILCSLGKHKIAARLDDKTIVVYCSRCQKILYAVWEERIVEKLAKELVEKWAGKFWELCCSLPDDVAIEDKERCVWGRLVQMFTEAGVEIEK